jgi:hypothetical protein
LESLIGLKEDLAKTRESLANFPWDAAEELVTLTVDHIRSVIERFVKGQLSDHDVENWADMIEGRDDIAYDEKNVDTIKQLVFRLANPVLSGGLDRTKGRDLLRKLDAIG